MTKDFPTLHKSDMSQEMYTPDSALELILPYLDREKIIWEMCFGAGLMANFFSTKGFSVIGERNMDCLTTVPEKFDVIITNPPYRNNKDFLERAINLKKPFALLMRLEHLGGVRAKKLLENIPLKILIPERRINFITPKIRLGIKVGGSPFHTIWVTSGLVHDTRQIIYL